MNKRIKELAEQATDDAGLNPTEFAELIVQECVELLEQSKNSHFVSLTEAKRMSHFVNVATKTIQKHFRS